jgi:hypothetical protein
MKYILVKIDLMTILYIFIKIPDEMTEGEMTEGEMTEYENTDIKNLFIKIPEDINEKDEYKPATLSIAFRIFKYVFNTIKYIHLNCFRQTNIQS